ncbi:unnamed protein product [Schistocephalus solidus]|uniref:Casein kinase I n=1 Tax=Schistocephalus solidus TaxID=70667 RepID=A0A183T2T9_SCHSO|nr:unnamed protein product [Schistocephalus solidus]
MASQGTSNLSSPVPTELFDLLVCYSYQHDEMKPICIKCRHRVSGAANVYVGGLIIGYIPPVFISFETQLSVYKLCRDDSPIYLIYPNRGKTKLGSKCPDLLVCSKYGQGPSPIFSINPNSAKINAKSISSHQNVRPHVEETPADRVYTGRTDAAPTSYVPAAAIGSVV